MTSCGDVDAERHAQATERDRVVSAAIGADSRPSSVAQLRRDRGRARRRWPGRCEAGRTRRGRPRRPRRPRSHRRRSTTSALAKRRGVRKRGVRAPPAGASTIWLRVPPPSSSGIEHDRLRRQCAPIVTTSSWRGPGSATGGASGAETTTVTGVAWSASRPSSRMVLVSLAVGARIDVGADERRRGDRRGDRRGAAGVGQQQRAAGVEVGQVDDDAGLVRALLDRATDLHRGPADAPARAGRRRATPAAAR